MKLIQDSLIQNWVFDLMDKLDIIDIILMKILDSTELVEAIKLGHFKQNPFQHVTPCKYFF